jgi:hypothetical protein
VLFVLSHAQNEQKTAFILRDPFSFSVDCEKIFRELTTFIIGFAKAHFKIKINQ